MRCILSVLAFCTCAAPLAAEATANPSEGWPLRDRASYLIGLQLSQQVKMAKLNPDRIAEGLGDGLRDQQPKVDPALAERIFQMYQQSLERERQKEGVAAKAAAAEYMARVAQQQGAITTPSGLVYEVLVEGQGPKPSASSTVRVNYEGKLIDGRVFDSSYKRGQPATFKADQVIKGWTEILQMMPVGSKYRVHIPPELGYGERGTPGMIGPNAALVFEIELLGIE